MAKLPSLDWMPGAIRNQRLSNAPYDEGAWDHPKGLLHTSEGFSIEASENACANGGFDPHFTIGPDPNRAGHVQIKQHYPLSSRATALENDGSLKTNRQAVIQVELVGSCDPKYKDHPLYVHNWADWYLDGIALWMKWIEQVAHVPHVAAPKWTAYPDSYGLNAPQRMSWDEFCNFSGWVGHEHAAGNVHGDPGDLDVVGKLLSRYGDTIVVKPAPVPVVKEPLMANRSMSTPKGDKQNLPRSRYHTIRFGKNDKGSLVSALGPGDDYAGTFTATVSLWMDGPRNLDHLEVLPYAVDSKTLKVVRTWPVATIGTWHTGGVYRLHAVFASSMGPGQRLRFQVQSDYKKVTITRAVVDVNYEKKAS